MALTVVQDWGGLQEVLETYAEAGERVCLVPTMGALHYGHVSLVELAKTQAERVVVSIFVNPTQFGPSEDYHKYPRVPEKDIALLESVGADVIYTPAAEEIYVEGHSSKISVGPLAERLCGQFRPGHFDGVCTVVAKLFNRVMPDVAIFGEKDFQQLTVLKKMAMELDFLVEIIGAPTVRETDGLALSSRNAYLGAEQRAAAPKLYAMLNDTAAALQNGTPVAEALALGKDTLIASGFSKVDYLELCDEETLIAQPNLRVPARLLVAAWLGTTRLIDNIRIG